ncbi:hypothetical protein GYMLUDRAFT_253068 [Collybiopsis luxurians FD-317 M1]|uniref:Uncharacterized protein n=1 Tax=Collybiopsis luxurians FD-317 M1 TaxID=944289 RepID=A0A0D0C6J1_9AGAR|nr:hypothetical protein GYMLUDRAFT_253068 [Collybiopsis luxurians FD-317 M1]
MTSLNPSSHLLPTLPHHPASDHISSTAIPIDPDQVVAIIESPKLDNTGSNAPENDELGNCKAFDRTQVASSPEIIRRMGIKAMLVDISGHANSTNAPGSNTPLVCTFGHANLTNELGFRMLNWLGGPGSADFLRNAKDFDYASPST